MSGGRGRVQVRLTRAAAGRRYALARTRVLVAFVAGGASYPLASRLLPWPVAALVSWDVAAGVVVGWIAVHIWSCDARRTAALATREDDSRAAADMLVVGACVASLGGVVVALEQASRARGAVAAVTTGVALVTVLLSWVAVQATFTLRYAHLYYLGGGGIDFGDDPPAYGDFAYVAFTIGMTYQVSDTTLTSKAIRRTATRHALVSYLFGAFIVAMTINALASLAR